jgi:hypothetical protein
MAGNTVQVIDYTRMALLSASWDCTIIIFINSVKWRDDNVPVTVDEGGITAVLIV